MPLKNWIFGHINKSLMPRNFRGWCVRISLHWGLGRSCVLLKEYPMASRSLSAWLDKKIKSYILHPGPRKDECARVHVCYTTTSYVNIFSSHSITEKRWKYEHEESTHCPNVTTSTWVRHLDVHPHLVGWAVSWKPLIRSPLSTISREKFPAPISLLRPKLVLT